MDEKKAPQEWWERIAKTEVRVENLEAYQKKQNGRLAQIEQKLTSSRNWLIGLMGGMIASLILLVINLALGH